MSNRRRPQSWRPASAGPRRWPYVAAAALAAGALLWAERRRPLRRRVESDTGHVVRNAVVALGAAAMTYATERQLVLPLARRCVRQRAGLVAALPAPRWVRDGVAFLLLDYTLWVWHWLNHAVPALWRFHLVHHVDRDLDASTGVRFHFGEIAGSALFRCTQVLLIGPRPALLTLWERALLAEVVFHHSNLRLPARIERALGRVVVTPRMHGIHHSRRPEEMGTNFASLLACWDALHGTLRLDVPQPAITIGVRGFERDQDVALPRILVLPFTALPE